MNSVVLHTKEALEQALGRKASVGFVPTMGFLHDGHLSLVREAKKRCEQVVVSIFVNPLQFNVAQDLALYPRDIDGDVAKLSGVGVDVVFIPDQKLIYPDQPLTTVSVSTLSSRLEGEFRPGHFDGVTTVVSLLFHLVAPTDAWFGEKDFQQMVIVERMVKDLHFPITVHRAPIIREPSGLAMSSRNSRLSAAGKEAATTIFKGLTAVEGVSRREKHTARLKAHFAEIIGEVAELKLEYVEIVDPESLVPVDILTHPARMLTAVWCEGVRLIDNIELRG